MQDYKTYTKQLQTGFSNNHPKRERAKERKKAERKGEVREKDEGEMW